jgi:hypothetical protein
MLTLLCISSFFSTQNAMLCKKDYVVCTMHAISLSSIVRFFVIAKTFARFSAFAKIFSEISPEFVAKRNFVKFRENLTIFALFSRKLKSTQLRTCSIFYFFICFYFLVASWNLENHKKCNPSSILINLRVCKNWKKSRKSCLFC